MKERRIFKRVVAVTIALAVSFLGNKEVSAQEICSNRQILWQVTQDDIVIAEGYKRDLERRYPDAIILNLADIKLILKCRYRGESLELGKKIVVQYGKGNVGYGSNYFDYANMPPGLRDKLNKYSKDRSKRIDTRMKNILLSNLEYTLRNEHSLSSEKQKEFGAYEFLRNEIKDMAYSEARKYIYGNEIVKDLEDTTKEKEKREISTDIVENPKEYLSKEKSNKGQEISDDWQIYNKPEKSRIDKDRENLIVAANKDENIQPLLSSFATDNSILLSGSHFDPNKAIFLNESEGKFFSYPAETDKENSILGNLATGGNLLADFGLTLTKRPYDFCSWVDDISGLNLDWGNKIYASQDWARSISDGYYQQKGGIEANLIDKFGEDGYNKIKSAEEFIADNLIITACTLGVGSAAGVSVGTSAKLLAEGAVIGTGIGGGVTTGTSLYYDRQLPNREEFISGMAEGERWGVALAIPVVGTSALLAKMSAQNIIAQTTAQKASHSLFFFHPDDVINALAQISSHAH